METGIEIKKKAAMESMDWIDTRVDKTPSTALAQLEILSVVEVLCTHSALTLLPVAIAICHLIFETDFVCVSMVLMNLC